MRKPRPNDLYDLISHTKNAQCNTLAAALGNNVVFWNSTLYLDLLSSYWAQQETQVTPTCIVQAACTEDVSKAVSLLSSMNSRDDNQCKFAIRSGGHGVYGASNLQGGINLDLSAMKSIEVSNDKALT